MPQLSSAAIFFRLIRPISVSTRKHFDDPFLGTTNVLFAYVCGTGGMWHVVCVCAMWSHVLSRCRRRRRRPWGL